ncbi:uncharacterized protein MONOS_8098 [Monocercomonoides exilis]|uniref:uncharacterized protein n=1 Tax=Monocercomonoides exilis TaxID=2049356 RepID=UPI00355A9F47|nr:hypothetical protein MONOS_8098 [Monocercomonoides exilis]|eukprot:MONOS_8098.1-p1 / transcript=MONOS_8098.1 / gene=MONOS_8098 / organism=Monocercomonoides_exilis_PA203 / gene_product=unspecified product / transcript_product=unspecified product / location=Mono_scaffold00296:19416-20022(-) / protein_length=150 / sequence_SO=supercontig / SO=protein_coding / is_pseudo=false
MCSSASPFRRRRSEEKKEAVDDQSSSSSSSAPVTNTSNALAVAASFTSAEAMGFIKRRLQIVEPEAAGVYARQAVLYGVVAFEYDVVLPAMLSILLVAPLPAPAASVGTKSGIKLIFAVADVNAFLSIFDLFGPSLLQSAIARLVSRSL